jgi:hypothetical protein
MLRRQNFREAAELRTRGAVEIPLPDDNAAALLEVLRFLHCRWSQLTEKVSLLELARIAIVVDKYGFHEVLQPQIDKWLGALSPWWSRPPSADGVGFFAALVVAWAFRRANEYEQLTLKAQREWDRPCDVRRYVHVLGDIPVPAAVFSKPCPRLPLFNDCEARLHRDLC